MQIDSQTVIRIELLSELTNIKLLWSTVTTVDNAGTAGGADNAGRVLQCTEARLGFISARDKLGRSRHCPSSFLKVIYRIFT